MRAKLVRENRKMKTNMRLMTVAVAALLVVLAGSGIAGAATMTLSVVVDNLTLYMDGNMGPTKTMYHVYASALGNTFTATTGGTPNPFTFYGGVRSFEINARFTTAAGQVHPTIDEGSVGGKYATAIYNDVDHVSDQPGGGSIPTTFLGGFFSGGMIVDSAGNQNPNGVGGLGLITSGEGVGGRMADNTTATAYRNTSMTNSQKKYAYGNTDAPNPTYETFNHPVWLYSGELNAVKEGTVTVDLDLVGANTRLWQIDTATGKLIWGTAPAVMNGTDFVLTVMPATPPNTAPTVSILGGDVLEGEWSKEPNWNNPLHSVEITAVGTDDGKPNPPGTLTYEWIMHKPGGGGSKVLADTDAVLQLTLAQIASMGLPPYVGVDDPSYHWDLSVKAFDGALYSPSYSIDVFVPEPATLGLLGFGVVGALLRRRRRA